MLIKSLKVDDFRNFTKKEIKFSAGLTVIVGDNATGKSNILEAIYLLATGKSFKAKLESEMIRYNSDIARISAKLRILNYDVDLTEENNPETLNTKSKMQNTSLEAVLTDGEVQIGEDSESIKKTQKKKLLVNGLPKRLIDFAGNLKVVLFGPWDLDLVTEAPSIRRRFLDEVLSQVDREYRRGVLLYEKGVRQRNKLLLRIRDEGIPRSQLLYWDKLLIKHGNYITEKRSEFIDFVNRTKDFKDRDYSLTYDLSTISEERLAKYANEEVYAGTTLVGPHRDDFVFEIRNTKYGSQDQSVIRNSNLEIRNSSPRDLARFGSRGEARMGVLWLKLAELLFVESVSGEKPVLLLDDIFSELDHEHRKIVLQVSENQQTIITTADPHYIEELTIPEEIINL
ncbi:MAG TPA: AAA family ATPase [Patescibacteria group bacterium]|nr:AAA family ATPase [Patescibacteria group bacterium]